MTRLLGVILAGGQARRMGGGDKGRLMLGGQSLMARVMDRLVPQVDALALNANGPAARFADLGIPVIADSVADFPGPLAGVLAGMDWAADHGATHIVTVAADTPFFPLTLVEGLQEALTEEGQIALAATPDPDRGWARHPTFGLWPVSLREDLRQALGQGVRKVVQWTDIHGTCLARFPAHPFDPFFNVNTPEDLAKAEDLL